MISGIRRLLPSLHMARPVRTELRARPELPRSGGGLQGCYYHKFHFYGTDSQIPMNLEKVHAECSCDAEEDVNTAAEQTRRCRGEGSGPRRSSLLHCPLHILRALSFTGLCPVQQSRAETAQGYRGCGEGKIGCRGLSNQATSFSLVIKSRLLKRGSLF